ncbi:MAG: hydrogenase nickel incorporation protein HypB [Thermoplasmata archaeon]|nr:hydrogenase nickel incorporation protein HypB [Thermoplasmata archaeon]
MHKLVEVRSGVDLLQANREIAQKNSSFLRERGIVSIDIMGSIGAGKTLLAEKMIDILQGTGISPAVIAGDVAGNADYQRFKKHGIPVENINTGKECHLDAHLVDHALEHMDLDGISVLFVENVGNLVCPADFALGTDKRMVVVSVTEGDDMIMKHPLIFGLSDVIAINKTDLAGAMEVDPKTLGNDARELGSKATVVYTDARHGEGIEDLMRALGLPMD